MILPKVTVTLLLLKPMVISQYSSYLASQHTDTSTSILVEMLSLMSEVRFSSSPRRIKLPWLPLERILFPRVLS